MTLRIIAGILIGAGIGAVTGHFGKCSSGTSPLTSTSWRGAVYGVLVGFFISMTLTNQRQCNATGKPEARTPMAAGKVDTAESAEAKGTVSPETQTTPHHITGKDDFDKKVLQASMPCLVDFYSVRCPPCRMLAPTIDKLAQRYAGKALICKANVDGPENTSLARQYGIRSIPAVLFFQDGKEVERYVGLRDEEDYASELDRLLPSKAPSNETATPAVETPTAKTDQ